MNSVNLIYFKIIEPCTCSMCLPYNYTLQEPLVYRILDSKYTIRKILGITTYWIGCPRSIDAMPSSFEEVFEGLTEEKRMVLIFNLDSFK